MNKIKARRLELGLSQPELAKALKQSDSRIDVGMISRFENSVCLPMPGTLIALETALQVPATELFSADELADIEKLSGAEPDTGLNDGAKLLLRYLRHGKANAMTRPTLCSAMGMTDRKVRELIEQARRAGYIIINAQDGCGYYLSDDPDEWARQYHQDTARALSILARRKTIRARLKAAGREV